MGAQDVAPLSMRRSVLGMTKETNSGTAAAVVAALANTAVYDAVFEPGDFFSEGERRADGISHGGYPRSPGMRKGSGTFKTEYRNGDATFALLELAGFVISGTGDNGDPMVATPSSGFSDHSTGTFRLWEDGGYQELYGAVISRCVVRPLKPGGRLVFDWAVDGVWGGDGTAALPAIADVADPTAAMRASGITLTLGGGALPQVSNFELDLGMQAEERESLTAINALAHMLVGDRQPTLTLDPESRKIADYDGIGKYESGLAEALVMGFSDPDGNTLQIDAAAAQRIGLGRSNRGKKKVDQLRLELCITTAGDDELVFTREAAA